VTVGNYSAFPNISTYPLNVYGGTGLGSVTRTLNSSGNSANCSLRDGMFLTATSSGVCSVTAVKAGGNNYFDETTTATIFWVPFITNYASSSSSVPTSIPISGQTGFERRAYETFTVISFADETGTAVTSIRANSKLRVIGTGFVADDATTQVFFGIESVSYSGLTFNTLDPLANYILLTVPTDAETDRVVMRSAKGWATSPGTLTITP